EYRQQMMKSINLTKEDMEKIHPPPVFEHIDTWAAVQVPIKTVATMENISSEKKADSPAL
ncbi:MAG: hypothetical protein ACE5FU_14295, partial [Nitrospinota bacterium]